MAFPTENDNDDSGEVISLDGNATDTAVDGAGSDDKNTGAEDRGDNFTPNDEEPATLTKAELKALVSDVGGTEEGRDAPAAKPNAIPKARFDEVNEARKSAQNALDAANAEIERLQAQSKSESQARPTFDEDAKEKEYIEAMLDGNTDRALAIRREINANIREQSRHDAAQDIEQRTLANSLDAESNQAINDYPYLDTEEGAYALDLIVVARDADIAKGVPPHLALRRAVAAIAPRFMPDDASPPTRDLSNNKAPLDTRTKDALARGARDSNLQPPALQAGIGTRITGARVDVAKLDDDQFKALSTAEKKRLRGD